MQGAKGGGTADHGVTAPANDEISNALTVFEARLRESGTEMRTQCLVALGVMGESLRHADSQAALLVCNGTSELVTLVSMNVTAPQLEEMLDFARIIVTSREEVPLTLQ